jgi:hypothetical protein
MKTPPIGFELKRAYQTGRGAWTAPYDSTKPPTIYLNSDYRYRNDAGYPDGISSILTHETLHLVITKALGGVLNEETQIANCWLDSQYPADLSGDFSSLDDFVHVEIPPEAREPVEPWWFKGVVFAILAVLVVSAIDWYYSQAATAGVSSPFTPVAVALRFKSGDRHGS